MDTADLQQRYRQLHSDLDVAYAAEPWDGEHIDRIACEMLELEVVLASQGVSTAAALVGAAAAAAGARAAAAAR